MKRKIFIAALLTVLATVFTASALPANAAKHRNYKNFSVELPDGWEPTDKSDSKTESVSFMNENEDSALVVIVRAIRGISSKDFAQQVSDGVQGTTPQPNGDGLYKFTYMEDGAKCRALAGIQGDTVLYLTCIGDDADLFALAKSLEFRVKFVPDSEGF